MERIELGHIDPRAVHQQVKNMYSWSDVAERTERVYQRILRSYDDSDFIDRLVKYDGCGIISGKLSAVIVTFDTFCLWVLDWMYPREEIDRAGCCDLELIKALVEEDESRVFE